jgi:hypothetical protein
LDAQQVVDWNTWRLPSVPVGAGNRTPVLRAIAVPHDGTLLEHEKEDSVANATGLQGHAAPYGMGLRVGLRPPGKARMMQKGRRPLARPARGETCT